jgi:hypothetical protein
MSDGDYQREGREYLHFVFEDEVIEPEQYLIWHQMREEETLMQYLEEYESTNS